MSLYWVSSSSHILVDFARVDYMLYSLVEGNIANIYIYIYIYIYIALYNSGPFRVINHKDNMRRVD